MRNPILALILLMLSAIFILSSTQSSAWADTSSDPSIFDNAVSLYYNGKTAESIDRFRDLTVSDPENDTARLNLIRLLQETGDYSSAIDHLKILIAKRPENAELYQVKLLKAYLLSGQANAAVQLVSSDDPSAEELYWKGLAWVDLGNRDEAMSALTASLVKNPFNPMANLVMGRLCLELENFEVAQNFLKRALNQEPNLTAAFYPLAQAYINLGKLNSAQNLLRNALYFNPWDSRIADTLKKLQDDHPELAAEAQKTNQRKLQFTVAPLVEPATSRESIPEIRIGLAENVRTFFVKTGDQFILSAPDSSSVYSGEPATVVCFRRTPDGLEALDEQGVLLFKSSQSIALTYANPAATTVLFDVELGPGSFWAGHVDRAYRGRLDFLAKPSGMTIVNRINIEEYLYSVVPSEIPSSWPLESLKSQAVAARTYALANLGQYAARGFDLLSTAASQAYAGVGAETPETRQAVDATRGIILTYQGRPIDAFFSANNGGYTETTRDIWGFDTPYLQALPDLLSPPRIKPLSPEDLASWLAQRPLTYSSNPNYSSHSAYRWVQWVSRDEIEYRLNMGDRLGSVVSVTVIGRTISGRAFRVLVKGTRGECILNGESIRSKFGGLRSNLFVVEPKIGTDGLPSDFIFTGGGWGHGIGMSQSGAAGMAADNYTADKILAFYYPGTFLATRY